MRIKPVPGTINARSAKNRSDIDAATPQMTAAMGGPIVRDVVPLLLVFAAGGLAVCWGDADNHGLIVQGVCIAAALLWLASRPCPPTEGVRRRPEIIGIIIVSVAAVLLRVYLIRYLPPPNQTGFEELQTGGIAHRILFDGGLPLEFRFTNLAAALGFLVGGESLPALRAPFIGLGLAALVLLASSLRHLGVGWAATTATCVTAASLRWLVIANVADELFASLWITAAIGWCLVRSERKPEQIERWAALAGVLAGMLMFEYTSYRVMILLAMGWFSWRTLRPVSIHPRLHARPLVAFVVAAAVMSAPMLADVARHPRGTIFFEAFRRHGGERRHIFSGKTLDHAKNYTKALAGGLSSANSFLAPHDEPIVPPLVGILVLGSAVAAAASRRRPILGAFVATVVGTIAAASLTANNAAIGRISPLLPLLLLLLGAFFDDIEKLFTRIWGRVLTPRDLSGNALALRLGTPQSTLLWKMMPATALASLGPPFACFAPLALFAVVLNVGSIHRMASDRRVMLEYCNDDYATAYWLGEKSHPGQVVFVITPDTGQGWLQDTDMIWLYARKNVTIHGYGQWPSPQTLSAGALVVVGVRGRSLSETELQALKKLAAATGASGRVDIYKNAARNHSVAMFELPERQSRHL